MGTPAHPVGSLRPAVVLRTHDGGCEVVGPDGPARVVDAAPFAPRAQSVSPGHLVAVTTDPAAPGLVLWRWFDAVVVEQSGGEVRLWEPGHGEVLARPRDPRRTYAPGAHAYLSAGLPGADWWVAGPSGRAEDADVELDEVHAFCDAHDLWARQR